MPISSASRDTHGIRCRRARLRWAMTETCDYAWTRSTRVKLGSGTCEPSTPDRLRSATRHVLSGLNTDDTFSLGRRDLLEQPLLEHLDFCGVFRAGWIHDEVRVPCGHASGKELKEPAGLQLRCY